MSLQKETILDLIKNQFGNTSVKQMQLTISKILNLSQATVYNKLVGRNDFSVVEFLEISKELGISIDSFLANQKMSKEKPLMFFSDGLEKNPDSFFEYFVKVFENVEKANPFSAKTKATFICLQPHVFHMMRYPYLLYLKMFTYNLINWKMPSMSAYDPLSFMNDEKTQKLIKKLYNAYQSIPLTEMVGHNFVHPICSQLDYLVKSRIIKDKEQLRQIKFDLHGLLDDLEKTASRGFRVNAEGDETPVEMYINKFIHVSNIILIESDEGGFFTIQSDVPDVLKTYDSGYIKHFKQWLDSNKEYTLNISKTGGLERNDFFDRNKQHIDMVMTNLENHFKQYN